MVTMKNPAFLNEEGKPAQGQYFVLFGADWNSAWNEWADQILEIPDHLMDPDVYPLQVGWRVIATEEEEMIGYPGTITKIWQATEDKWLHRGVGTWLCQVTIDAVEKQGH